MARKPKTPPPLTDSRDLTLWRGLGALQIRAANGIEESTAFLFKTIQTPARTGAGHADFDRQVEYQRQIRTQIALHKRFKRCDTGVRQTATAALIRIGGVGKPVAQHHRTAGQRRADDLGQMLGACREHQQQLGIGAHGIFARCE